MDKRIGKFIIQKVAGGSYKAYIPPKLPPDPPIDLTHLYPYLEKATLALAELNNMTKSIPNTSLFIHMYVRKEALLSSQIEGTQSSFSDLMLFEHQQRHAVSLEDVEEVSNYVKAIHYGLNRLKGGFPLSLRLIREIHNILLSGSRGSTKAPGEFRRSQNWIGGIRPGNALFVPPPIEYLDESLTDFEKFLHDDTLPVLIKAAIAHVQFETIHPFLDGNGRLGRLLIILLLCNSGILDEPILYLSVYLKQNKKLYYDLLQQVRLDGTWETWIEFFLNGVFSASKQASATAIRINKLFEDDRVQIEAMGRARFSCLQTLEYLKQLPQVTVQHLSRKLEISPPTARSSLNSMVSFGILREISGKERDKIYVYKKYLDILEEGAIFLVDAAESGNVEAIRTLLDSGYNANEIRYGKTALHHAAELAGCTGYPSEIVGLLFNAGADVNVSDDDGHTALYYAAKNGWIEAVKMLAPKTDYNGLNKALKVAEHFYHATGEQNQVFNLIFNIIKNHPNNVNKTTKVKTSNIEAYNKNIKDIEELCNKYITPLYSDDFITLAKLEKTINYLSSEDPYRILTDFRRLHKDLKSNDIDKSSKSKKKLS